MSKKKKKGTKPSPRKKPDKKSKVSGRWAIALSIAGVLIIAIVIWGVIGHFGVSTKKNATSGTMEEGTSLADSATLSYTGTKKIEVETLEVSEVTNRSITITWKTDVPSTSEVIAYEQENSFMVAGWPDEELVTEHEFIIEDLEADTTYFLTVKSEDVSGNQVIIELNEPYRTLVTRLTTEIVAGQTSPDLTLSSTDGESVSLSDFRGKRVLLLFWKANCNSCREELPHVDEFWRESAHDDFTLLTINVNEKKSLVTSYIEGQKFSFPVLLDTEGKVADTFTIATYPTTFLVDENQLVTKVKEASFKNKEEIEEFIYSAPTDN